MTEQANPKKDAREQKDRAIATSLEYWTIIDELARRTKRSRKAMLELIIDAGLPIVNPQPQLGGAENQ